MTKYTYIVAILITALLGYFGWQIGRKVNYSFSYEDMVQETICEHVKPQYLKRPCK